MRKGVYLIAGGFAGVVGGLVILGAAFLILFGSIFSSGAAACVPPDNPSAPGTAPPNATLSEAIKINTEGNPRLALSMFMATWLESRWNCDAVGAGSYGCYQVQNPGAYPNPDITIEQALSPAYSTNYMLPQFQSAMGEVDDAEWTFGSTEFDFPFGTHPAEMTGEKVAKFAERPAEWYHDHQGYAAVHEAFEASLDEMDRIGISTAEFRAGLDPTRPPATTPGTPSGTTTATPSIGADPGDSSSCTADPNAPIVPLAGWNIPLREGSYTVTSAYGMRWNPVTGIYTMHNGIDLGAPEGTPITAINTGTVIEASYNDISGKYIKVEHEGGDVTEYLHQVAFDKDVVIGQPVPADRIIGYVGTTGRSTGNHLHFITRPASAGGNHVDPDIYMKERGLDLYAFQQ